MAFVRNLALHVQMSRRLNIAVMYNADNTYFVHMIIAIFWEPFLQWHSKPF